MNKNLKKFYSFDSYKPNKRAVPVDYKGTHYLSKAQCMALEGITRKELDEYLKGVTTPNDTESLEEPHTEVHIESPSVEETNSNLDLNL